VGAESWDQQVGSVADEASRLLESLRRSAAEAAAAPPGDDDGPDAAAPGPASGSPRAGAQWGGMPLDGTASNPDGAAHDPLCAWCPLCRGAAVVRSLSPQTLTRLADLASLAATVLTEIAGSRTGGPASPPQGAPAEPADRPVSPSPRPATGARRSTRSTSSPRTPAPSRPIPVSDADDPQEAPRG